MKFFDWFKRPKTVREFFKDLFKNGDVSTTALDVKKIVALMVQFVVVVVDVIEKIWHALAVILHIFARKKKGEVVMRREITGDRGSRDSN